MGKSLKTVGVIIGAAALIATGVGALAMPALAGTTTLLGVSVGTLNTISSGLIAVGGMLEKPKSQGSASPDEWTSNPDQPIPFLMGRMGVAGKIVQRDEFGPDNMYQGIVGILSGAGPIRAVNGFAGDKQAVTFGANGIAVSSQWQGEMWMVRRAGEQPDTVLTVPSGLKLGGAAFEWSSAAKLSGKACYLQVLGENSKGSAYPAGIPDPVHDAEGIFGYDPRYDDTYAGGVGPCRLGVRPTYRWIDNGGIGGLNWALGLVENGQVIGGIGSSIDGIDVPAFVEVANIADANGWKLAAWPDTSEDVSAVLDQLLQAAGAVRARHAGKISCVSRGAPRASVATITARDTAGDIELDTAPSLYNRLNTITPRFMSEAAGWVLTPANAVSFPQYVTDDGGKHGDQIDYRFVPLLKQAAELAAYDILDAREPFSGTIPLKAHMRHLKRGDTFLVSEPGFLMDGVKCIVLSRSYDPKTAQVRIGFRSETDSKHALALGKTTTLPTFPVLTPTDPTFVSPPGSGDWTVTPRPPATGGAQLPGFDLTGLVNNSTATAILVEYGPSATGPWTQAYQGPPTVTNVPIDGVQPGETYYIAVSYQRDSNYSAREVYGPYTAPLLIASDLSPLAPVLRPVLDGLALIPPLRADLNKQAEVLLQEVVGRWDRDRGERKATIEREDVIKDDLVSTRETLEIADATGIALLETTKDLILTDLSTEVTARTLQAAGFNNSLAIIETLNETTASDLQAYTLTSQTQISQLGTNLAVVDTRSLTTVTELSSLASTTTALSTSFGTLSSYAYGQIGLLTDDSVAQATAINLISAQSGSNAAAVSSLNTAIVNETSARATADSSLQTLYNGVSSTVSIQQTAISGLQAQDNIARFDVVAAAGGGSPARLGLISAILGSQIALDADQIFFGPNTYFEKADFTLRTNVGGVKYVEAWGPPFGPDSLIYWRGPAGLAETKANAEANGGSWEDSNGAAFFGGATPAGPFDSGVLSPSFVALDPSNWTNLAVVQVILPGNGYMLPRIVLEHNGSANADSEGLRTYDAPLRILSTDLSGNDPEVLFNDLSVSSTVGVGGTFPVTPLDFAGWLYAAGTRRGRRLLILQGLRGPAPTTNVQVRNIRFYGVTT